jgi:hypothetical protein
MFANINKWAILSYLVILILYDMITLRCINKQRYTIHDKMSYDEVEVFRVNNWLFLLQLAVGRGWVWRLLAACSWHRRGHNQSGEYFRVKKCEQHKWKVLVSCNRFDILCYDYDNKEATPPYFNDLIKLMTRWSGGDRGSPVMVKQLSRSTMVLLFVWDMSYLFSFLEVFGSY